MILKGIFSLLEYLHCQGFDPFGLLSSCSPRGAFSLLIRYELTALSYTIFIQLFIPMILSFDRTVCYAAYSSP